MRADTQFPPSDLRSKDPKFQQPHYGEYLAAVSALDRFPVFRCTLKLDRVMVCWDGGRAAARAIGDAIPFLERAGRIEVVIVTNERSKIERADIGAHLARHGLNAKIKRMPPGDIDVADVLLSYAADEGVDFIVMGGYGHARLREFVLGGVTRSMLRTMTVPVLMSH